MGLKVKKTLGRYGEFGQLEIVTNEDEAAFPESPDLLERLRMSQSVVRVTSIIGDEFQYSGFEVQIGDYVINYSLDGVGDLNLIDACKDQLNDLIGPFRNQPVTITFIRTRSRLVSYNSK